MIAVLLSATVSGCTFCSGIRAKESILHNRLFTLRMVIDIYTYDKQKAPRTLQDLIAKGYLRKLPVDPMTGSATTWKVLKEDESKAVKVKEPGIFDVRSGSDGIALDGSRYRDW